MKVFICWSGDQSKAIASALREFLSDVIQTVEPFMSQADIKAGGDWAETLHRELKDTRFGILCLTPDNLDSRWIHYEAGALSKALNDDPAFVCPCLYNLSLTDVEWPLARFQGKVLNEEGLFDVVKTLNEALDESLSTERLRRAFEKFYPDLNAKIEKIPEGKSDQEPQHRNDRELLEEILQLLRTQSRGANLERSRQLHFVTPRLSCRALLDELRSYQRLLDNVLADDSHILSDVDRQSCRKLVRDLNIYSALDDFDEGLRHPLSSSAEAISHLLAELSIDNNTQNLQSMAREINSLIMLIEMTLKIRLNTP